MIVVYTLIMHGPSPGKYLYLFSRVLPLFFGCILVSRNRKAINGIIWCALIGTCLKVIPLVNSLTEYGNILTTRTQLYKSGEFNPSIYGFLNVTQHFVAVLVLIIAFSIYFRCSNKLLKMIILCLIIINGYSVISSTFAASIMTLIIGLSVYGLLTIFRRGNRLYSVILTMIFFSSSLLIIHFINEYAFDTVSTIRLNRALGVISGEFDFQSMDEYSGHRITKARISIETFLEKPYFGGGIVYGIAGHTSVMGGHNTYFDTLAQMGLLGAAPVFCMIFSWFWAALKLYRNKRQNYLYRSLVACWATYLIGCSFNPYLFQPSMDHYLYSFAGITVGLALQYEKDKKRLTYSGMFPKHRH